MYEIGKFNLEKIIVSVLFFVSPVYGLIFAFKQILRGYHNYFIFIALFAAIFAFLSPPADDLYRHQVLFDILKSTSFDNFRLSIDDDFVVQYVYYAFNLMGINFEWARFIFQFISIYIYSYVFVQLNNNKKIESNTLWVFILNLGLFSFLGVRSPLAQAILILGYFYLYHKKSKVTGICLMLFSSLIHYFFLYVSLAFIFCYYLPHINYSKSLIICCSFFAIGLGLTVVNTIGELYFSEKMLYIDGEWGTDHQYSFAGLVFNWAQKILKLPLLLAFIKINERCDKMQNLIFVMFILSLLTLNFPVIFSRLYPCLTMVLLINYVVNSEYYNLKIKKIILYSAILMFVLGLYAKRDFFVSENNKYYELFLPVPISLCEGFSNDWINSHIDFNGSFIVSFKR